MTITIVGVDPAYIQTTRLIGFISILMAIELSVVYWKLFRKWPPLASMFFWGILLVAWKISVISGFILVFFSWGYGVEIAMSILAAILLAGGISVFAFFFPNKRLANLVNRIWTPFDWLF